MKNLKDNFCHIPIDMCTYALRNKFVRPFQLFIYLKTICKGHLQINNEVISLAAEKIGLNSERTIKNNLKLLLRKNWIGFNKKTGIYFIRGHQFFKTQNILIRRIYAEFDIREIRQFKAFIIGALIANLIRKQKWLKREVGRNKGQSNQAKRQATSYFPIANLALSKILGVSISTAFEYKLLAKKAQYIKIKKQFIATGHDVRYKESFKKANEDIANRTRVVKRELLLQDCDLVISAINLIKRKKSKHISRVVKEGTSKTELSPS